MSNVLAVDMGGSKYIVGIVNENGEVLASEKYLWDELTQQGVHRSIVTASKALLEKYPQYPCVAAGATIPGLADPESGVWVEASFSGIRDYHIAEQFEADTGFRTFIDNDSRACLLAEKMFGAAKDPSITDFTYLTVSNGCGGALFVNGKVYRGGLGNAGEIGHCTVKENGRQCKCGSTGCLEIEASGRNIPLNYLELGGSETIDGEAPTAQSIDRLARKGDPVAIATYELEGRYIGKALAMVANIANPQLIVIGGGVSLGFDLFEAELKRTLAKEMYVGANRELKVVSTMLGYNGALIGAAALAFNGLEPRYY